MNKEQIFNEIKKDMIQNKTWGRELNFECFTDGIFTFGTTKKGIYTEIGIISEGDFLSDELAPDLLERDIIGYLKYATYNEEGVELIKSIVYRPGACLGLN